MKNCLPEMASTQTCITASLKWKRRRKKTIMKYNIVTIEREYASGGREIGYRTAEKLGIPYYGKEILEMAAKKKGVSPEYLEELEETPTNSFFYSVYMLSKNLIGDTPSPVSYTHLDVYKRQSVGFGRSGSQKGRSLSWIMRKALGKRFWPV